MKAPETTDTVSSRPFRPWVGHATKIPFPPRQSISILRLLIDLLFSIELRPPIK